MVYNTNTRRLFEIFLKLNPRGSVSEFARCRAALQAELDFQITSGNQQSLNAL